MYREISAILKCKILGKAFFFFSRGNLCQLWRPKHSEYSENNLFKKKKL